jgi:hypothetical protein
VAELPEDGYAMPELPDATLFGDESTYPACQDAARQLRQEGADRMQVRGAALLPGQAAGWTANPTLATAPTARDGLAWVLFGPWNVVGWVAVDGGAPPELVLPLVRHL